MMIYDVATEKAITSGMFDLEEMRDDLEFKAPASSTSGDKDEADNDNEWKHWSGIDC